MPAWGCPGLSFLTTCLTPQLAGKLHRCGRGQSDGQRAEGKPQPPPAQVSILQPGVGARKSLSRPSWREHRGDSQASSFSVGQTPELVAFRNAHTMRCILVATSSWPVRSDPLASHSLQENSLGMDGAICIATALKGNHGLTYVK